MHVHKGAVGTFLRSVDERAARRRHAGTGRLDRVVDLREMCDGTRYMVIEDIAAWPHELPKICQRVVTV